MHWVDARDVLADGLTNGGVDRASLHKASTDCQFPLAHKALTHTKFSVGSATIAPVEDWDVVSYAACIAPS